MKISIRLTLIYSLILIFFIIFSAVFFYWNTERLLLDEIRKELLRGPSIEDFLTRGTGYGKLSSLYIVSKSVVVQDPFGLGFKDKEGIHKVNGIYVFLVEREDFLVGKDITPTILALNRLKSNIILLSLFSVVASLIVGYILSQRFLSPLRDMIRTARDINVRDLDKRIGLPGVKDELFDLALTINNMLERVSSAYKMQEQFILDVSHELRTPLTSLLGHIRLLQRWGKEDKKILEESLESIRETAEDMERLINTLLETLKTQEDVSLGPIDLESFLEKRKEYYEKLYPDFQFDIILDDPKREIYSSLPILELVFNILVENAVKNSPDKKVVELGWERDSFFVRDYGRGIPQEERERIFERFYRLDDSRSDGGYGLGLSLAKKLVQILNFKIYVESEEGKGSTFYIVTVER